MRHRLHHPIAVVLCTAGLAACGGNPGGDPSQPLSPAAAPAAPAALEADTESLALFVSGRTRFFTITNVGGQRALDIAVTHGAALPAGTDMSTDCATLAPGETCRVSIAPGGTPSAAPGDTQAAPIVLQIAGSNTGALDLPVQVLDHGSVYQGGYLFAIDDSPDTTSIGGKVLALPNQAASWLGGLSDTPIAGTERATSATDGRANTRVIVDYMQQAHPGVDRLLYPAGICDASNEAGHDDCYLPAVCEFSYDLFDPTRVAACGNRNQPGMQNVQTGWLDGPASPAFGQIASSSWWSSTENGLNPTGRAFHYIPNAEISISAKTTVRGVACARQLTH